MIQSKLPSVGTTIFTVMSQMAKEYKVINLSQGFPDFPMNEDLIELVQQTATSDCYQYAPMSGNSELLNSLALVLAQQYGRTANPDKEILVTAGATQAIFTTIQALIHPGDEVLILDPCYDCYDAPIVLCGGIARHISLNQDFLPDWDMVEQAVNSKTKMLIINNPHNPSGRVFKKNDFDALKLICDKNPQLLILSDEVYEFISFEQKHYSINSIPELAQRAVVVSSFGKTFHMTGWKVGYCVAPEDLMKEIKKVHQFLVFSVNSLAQAVLSKYLNQVDVGKLGAFYQSKRDLFRKLMEKSNFDLLPCEGTYFQLASYSKISGKSDVDFVKDLVREHGVAAIPVSVFNEDKTDRKIIRFCFAKKEETLIQAAERLCRI